MRAMRKYGRLVHLPSRRRHRAVTRLAKRAIRDDRGGEVVEYALIAGLIVCSAIAAITCVGQKVLGRWNALKASV